MHAIADQLQNPDSQCIRSLIASDGTAAAVDPVEPRKMLAAASKEGATVTSVLTTHKHACVSSLAAAMQQMRYESNSM